MQRSPCRARLVNTTIVLAMFCAYMWPMSTFRDLYPPPWRVERMPGGYAVIDSRGFTLLRVYAYDYARIAPTSSWDKLSWAHAHTLAKAVAGLGQEKAPATEG